MKFREKIILLRFQNFKFKMKTFGYFSRNDADIYLENSNDIVEIPWYNIDADIEGRITKYINEYFSKYKSIKISRLHKKILFNEVSIFFSNSDHSIFIFIIQYILKKNQDKLLIYFAETEWEKKIVKYFYPSLTVINISFIFQNFKILQNIINFGFRKIQKSLIKKSFTTKVKERQNSNDGHNSTIKKIYIFPHKSLQYGNLFSKEYMIPNVKNVEISFFEWKFEDSVNEYYLKKGFQVQYISETLYKIRVLSLTKMINSLLIEFIKNVYLFNVSFAKSILRFQLLKTLIKRYFENRKPDLFIVGYDLLFPLEFFEALNELQIKTSTILERSLFPFYLSYQVNTHNYYISGPGIESQIRKNIRYDTLELISIGLIRTDYIFQYTNLSKQSDNYILVLDFHSEIGNNLSINSWRNNLIFYNSIYSLAKDFPDYHFIIRGKNINWLKLNHFDEIKNKINNLKNIEINQSNEFSESYRLLAKSSGVICRQTSLADEAICAGYKVIFYDEYAFGNLHLEKIFDYKDMAIISKDSVGLKNVFNEFIKEGKEFRDFKKIQKFYGSYDGSVKKRYNEHISQTLSK